MQRDINPKCLTSLRKKILAAAVFLSEIVCQRELMNSPWNTHSVCPVKLIHLETAAVHYCHAAPWPCQCGLGWVWLSVNGSFGCIGCRQVGFPYLHVRVMAVNRPLYVIGKHKISECSRTLCHLWRAVLICWQVGQLSHSCCSDCCLLISQIKNLIYLFLSLSHTQHLRQQKKNYKQEGK